jgi:hypothetical protein
VRSALRASWVCVLLLAACGKVGDPRPPAVRIPEPIRDLSATQIANDIVLTWTNPPLYIDASPVTDLTTVHVTSNGSPLPDLKPTGAGTGQSLVIPIGGSTGVARTFNVWLETARGKKSEPASTAFTPVDIPGAARALRAVVDQYEIQLLWEPPVEHPELANGYFVRRIDREEGPVLTEQPSFKDAAYDPQKTYTYEVVSTRRLDARWITGVAAPPLQVNAVDQTPPKTPSNVEVVVSPDGAYVTWDANAELDLAGYRVFRDGEPIAAGLQTGNSYFDANYRPGMRYTVAAVDEAGNASARSP